MSGPVLKKSFGEVRGSDAGEGINGGELERGGGILGEQA